MRRRAVFSAAAFAAVLLIGLGLRLWHLSTSPAWQWDEAVYWRVSANVQHRVLSEHSENLRHSPGSRSCTSPPCSS